MKKRLLKKKISGLHRFLKSLLKMLPSSKTVVVQKAKGGEINWIIETKGRVWEGTTAKDEAMDTWCKRIEERTGTTWRYRRIDQAKFDSLDARALSELMAQIESADRLV